jgi:ABC-type polysaccharide/polyol phosphate transport system ATPase subunit
VTSITADNLGVRFLFDKHRRVVTPNLARLRRGVTEAWGLRHLSLTASAGDGIALLGSSGSGKTTLLRALAGIFPADEGSVTVDGQIASLLSIDAGLLPPLTGRENAALLMTLGGLLRSEARERLDDVRERSQLDVQFERPVSSYSQGMRARLSLGASDTFEASVLLLDEVHEALDHQFRSVLDAHTEALLASGGIVVAAGHDHPMLARLCPRALWLEGGRVRAEGPFQDVLDAYLGSLEESPETRSLRAFSAPQ